MYRTSGEMEPHKAHEQEQYSNVASRNAALGTRNNSFLQDPSSSINTNVRPPDFQNPPAARPVHNYSIQTGEEFALEFMRLIPRQQLLPSTYADSNAASNYTDLKGILGISHAGSESGSNLSMISSKGTARAQEIEKKNMHGIPQTSTDTADNKRSQVHVPSQVPETPLSKKLKFLCSFGGKIMPRPGDGKLRYVGGETHIIKLSRDISWHELIEKTRLLHRQNHFIKYQLPGEELDALISVSSDEDLCNMMEECEILGDDGSQKFRIFLFSGSDFDDSMAGLDDIEGDYEIQYVLAVNGMNLGSRKGSIALRSTGGSNLDELLNLNVGANIVHAGNTLAGPQSMPSLAHMPSSTKAVVQSMPLSLTHVGESGLQSYKGQMVDQAEDRLEISSTVNPKENSHNVDGKSNVSSSAQHAYIPNNSKLAPKVEKIEMPLHANLTSHGGGVSIDRVPSYIHAQYAEVQQKGDSIKTKISSENNQIAKEMLVKDEGTKRDNSFRKRDEPGNFSNQEEVDNSCTSAAALLNSVPRNIPDVTSSSVDAGPPFLLSQNHGKLEQSAKTSKFNEISKGGNRDKYREDELVYSSKPAYEAESEEFNYLEVPAIPQRVFHSERIMREPVEQTRLSKSNDLDPQVLISHSHSNILPQMEEKVDYSSVGNMNSINDQSISTETSNAKIQLVRKGQTLPQKYDKSVEDSDRKASSSAAVMDEINSTTSILRAAQKDGHIVVPAPSAKILPNSVDGIPSRGKLADMKNTNSAISSLPSMVRTEKPLDISQREPLHVGVTGQSDIRIDINERFPPEFFSDIFSKANISRELTEESELDNDRSNLSSQIENQEPEYCSFFQNVAENDLGRKDVSLIDQDHIGFPSSLNDPKGTPMDYSYPPWRIEEFNLAHINSNFSNEAIQRQSPGRDGAGAMDLHSDLSLSNNDESFQVDGLVDPKIIYSKNEEGKLEADHTGKPLADIPSGEIDISSLQFIENEDLEELKELGSGTFGTVYHGRWRGTDVAIKRFKKSCFTGRSSEQERLTTEFWTEADILSKLHHPNVVAFYGVVQNGPGGTLATVTEYMVNGSLRNALISKERHLDRRKKLLIAKDAAFGMEYLHSKNIVHFDLKCDNLLVNLKDPLRPICKVGDFGLSKIKRNTLVTGGVRGTLPWMAPELLNGNSSKVSEKVDVFSFGIVLWEILTGEEPYANMHYGAIIGGIVNNTLRPHVPSSCDPEWRLLMEQCWAPDPATRPSFVEIVRCLRVMTSAVSHGKSQTRNQVSK
ncbi:uncharacterized protein LOC124937580 isoform X2 [Impatiens glandulifera]|uniref:uncharacterized protein LOC124937580 isoform X2 n=1 Tax=Impatiens glandulifera TaxID=253017 RepID=UPI001FB0EAED|nr:uncharacterized protein LOC124937580 isoform X2 [Impatiens glandulifera]